MNNYTANRLKKVLTSYNKSVRKKTYKGVSKMKRNQVETIIQNDFIMTSKKIIQHINLNIKIKDLLKFLLKINNNI